MIVTIGDEGHYWNLVDELRPGMLLNILHCPGQPSTAKVYLGQNVSNVRLRNLVIEQA